MAFSSKIKLLGALAAIAVLVSGMAQLARRGNDVWAVFVTAIPSKFSAKGAVDMESSYILRQTHEPLFRQDDGENFQTRVLASWSRSPDYKTYNFCPDTSLVFYGSRKFSADYFDSYISSVTRGYSTTFSQSVAGGCVSVSFPKSARGYLHYLTSYENAPSVHMSDRAEAGLGPFAVSAMTEKEIRLERKRNVPDGYNSIVLRQYTTGDDIAGKVPIGDFNKILFNKKWKTSDYFAFDNVEPRSIVLLINHPDKNVRGTVFNCLDIDRFNKAYVPTLGNFNYIGNVLPMGMVGAQWGRPNQNCSGARRLNPGEALTFANYQPGNDEALRSYMGAFSAKTGLAIKAKRFSNKELVDMIKAKPKRQPYQLIVFMVDSTHNEYDAIFDYFYGEGTVIADMPQKKKALYTSLIHEEDPGKKEAIARDLAAFLAEEYFALPLFQYSKTMYYPKNIKNINVGRGFIEYPEVAEFRL